MRILILTSSLLVLATSSLCAQISSITFGISGTAGNDQHRADFNNFPDVPKPEAQFRDTAELGWRVGLVAEYPFGKFLSGGIQLNYRSISAAFQAHEETVVGIVGVPTLAIIRHQLNTQVRLVEIEPFISLNPFAGLRVQTGLSLGFPISSEYDQSQQIAEPEGVGFINTPEPFTGSVPNLSNPLLAITARVGYEIPINARGSLRLRPEISVQQTLGTIVQETEWKTTSLRGGIALLFGPEREIPVQRDTVYQRDTTSALLFEIEDERVRFVDQTVVEEEIPAENVRLFRTTISERYVLELPRPRPILTGSIETRFVSPEGEELRQATLNIVYKPVERRTLFPRTSVIDTLAETDPPTLRFQTTSVSEAGIAEWQFILSVGAQEIVQEAGTGEPPKNFTVSLEEYEDFAPFLREGIDYRLNLTDEEGQTVTGAEGSIRFTANEAVIEQETHRVEYWLPVSTEGTGVLSPEEGATAIQSSIADLNHVSIRYWGNGTATAAKAHALRIAAALGLSEKAVSLTRVVANTTTTETGGVIVAIRNAN